MTNTVLKNKKSERIKRNKEARDQLKLFRQPSNTLSHCSQECRLLLHQSVKFILSHKITCFITLFSFIVMLLLTLIEGPHSKQWRFIWQHIILYGGEWIFLGLLSSIGLGTGLHTFVLYLGPFVAKVSLAAAECGTVDFDVMGPRAFLCPPGSGSVDAISSSSLLSSDVRFLDIFSKVQFPCLCWGIGTAIGELPPYFVARAARQSGESLEEVSEDMPSGWQRFQWITNMVTGRYAFLFIFLMSSVPNPLFDITGIMCGYSLVAFTTFFGATLLGKAVVKAQLQSMSVLTVFSMDHLAVMIRYVERIVPGLKGRVQEAVQRERARFHPENSVAVSTGRSTLSRIWDLVIIAMMSVFVISIINSTAQRHLMRKQEEEMEQEHDHESEKKKKK
eukprot:gb/GECH01014851.1/.p1 GENE.gb/GECH01014851.1/~~gb/GECH01014851.1/.p1  ORF type:complete len:391 (+),score=73.89 gb/GECH01014851.1/:1-1173(+)